MTQSPNERNAGAPGVRRGVALIAAVMLFAAGAMAGDASFTNLLIQGESAVKQRDLPGALKFYAEAEKLAGTNCPDLCVVARYYCESMRDTSSHEAQKTLAALCRDCSARAVTADPKSATAHLSLAIACGRSLSYCDNETKVRWSKAMKAEAETTIALDPGQDVAWYLLGRWNFGTANLNFFLRGWVKLVYGALPKASNQEAVKDFKKAIELAPGRIIHHAGLAMVYEELGEKKLELAELKKCQELTPVDREDEEEKKDTEKKLAGWRQ